MRPSTLESNGFDRRDEHDTAVAIVVPLNEAAVQFASLNHQIRGTAVDWSPAALKKLRSGLAAKFAEVVGANPQAALDELIASATTPYDR